MTVLHRQTSPIGNDIDDDFTALQIVAGVVMVGASPGDSETKLDRLDLNRNQMFGARPTTDRRTVTLRALTSHSAFDNALIA